MGTGVTLRVPGSMYTMNMGRGARKVTPVPIFIEKTEKPYLEVAAGMVLRAA
jgi:hypothetical protein